MDKIIRICGNCNDFDSNVCTIRYTIKNGVRSPMRVSFNKLGCGVFMYKILQDNKEPKTQPITAHK